jgi:hypothetical protein
MIKIRNFLFWTFLTLYVATYGIGTAVAINDKNLLLTAMFFTGFGLIGGIIIGRWTAEKDQQRWEEIMQRYNLKG